MAAVAPSVTEALTHVTNESPLSSPKPRHSALSLRQQRTERITTTKLSTTFGSHSLIARDMQMFKSLDLLVGSAPKASQVGLSHLSMKKVRINFGLASIALAGRLSTPDLDHRADQRQSRNRDASPTQPIAVLIVERRHAFLSRLQ